MSDEYIKRSDARRIVLHYTGDAAVVAIEDLPPEDVARVRRANVVKKQDWRGLQYEACELCDFPLASIRLTAEGIFLNGNVESSYCSNCGAILNRQTQTCEQSVL